MITAQQREAEFRKDLKALLNKYRAEMDITDDGKPYGWQSGVVEITMDGLWDKETFEELEQFAQFRL